MGAGGCGILLLIGLLRPGWLSERWARDFEVSEPDVDKQMFGHPDRAYSNRAYRKNCRGNWRRE